MSFKQVTPENWTDPDPTSTQFGRESVLVAAPLAMDGDDWARAFLAVELKEHVPEEIRDLFAVARGAAVYGWYFYPLFYLGEEQLHRVVEAAAKSRYHQVGGSKRRPSFEQAVERLIQLKVIPEADLERWNAVRWLRNVASHPSRQSVTTPGAVLSIFRAGAHDINRLFARAAHYPSAEPDST